MNISYWLGAFGKYEVPKAIIDLANMVNRKDQKPPLVSALFQVDPIWSTPGYLVVEEWGNWRDAEEEKAWNKSA